MCLAGWLVHCLLVCLSDWLAGGWLASTGNSFINKRCNLRKSGLYYYLIKHLINGFIEINELAVTVVEEVVAVVVVKEVVVVVVVGLFIYLSYILLLP